MTKTIVFVLDETGSMYGQREQTITQFNHYLEQVAKEEKKKDPVSFSFYLFNSDKFEARAQGSPIKKVSQLTYESYKPSSNTPLYDAIGKAVAQTEGPALVVILTDGQENSSQEYTLLTVKALIESKEKEGWKFIFLGSDLNVTAQASMMGLAANTMATYRSTGSAIRAAGAASVAYATSTPMMDTQSYVKQAEQEEDNESN
jgi:hypothetical protein